MLHKLVRSDKASRELLKRFAVESSEKCKGRDCNHPPCRKRAVGAAESMLCRIFRVHKPHPTKHILSEVRVQYSAHSLKVERV